MWNIQLFKLNFDRRESDAVARVVSGGWLSMGEETNKFESEFGSFLGDGAHCRAVSNGTAALHMALLALNVGPDDDVIIPSLTFVADVNVVNLVGANPILADATSLTDWNMSLESIEKNITDRTMSGILFSHVLL